MINSLQRASLLSPIPRSSFHPPPSRESRSICWLIRNILKNSRGWIWNKTRAEKSDDGEIANLIAFFARLSFSLRAPINDDVVLCFFAELSVITWGLIIDSPLRVSFQWAVQTAFKRFMSATRQSSISRDDLPLCAGETKPRDPLPRLLSSLLENKFHWQL